MHSRIARALQSASAPSSSLPLSPSRSYLQSQPPRRDCVFRGACRLSPFKTLTPNAERVSPRVDGEREGEGFSIEISRRGDAARETRRDVRAFAEDTVVQRRRPLRRDCSEKLQSTVDYFNFIMTNILFTINRIYIPVYAFQIFFSFYEFLNIIAAYVKELCERQLSFLSVC